MIERFPSVIKTLMTLIQFLSKRIKLVRIYFTARLFKLSDKSRICNIIQFKSKSYFYLIGPRIFLFETGSKFFTQLMQIYITLEMLYCTIIDKKREYQV